MKFNIILNKTYIRPWMRSQEKIPSLSACKNSIESAFKLLESLNSKITASNFHKKLGETVESVSKNNLKKIHTWIPKSQTLIDDSSTDPNVMMILEENEDVEATYASLRELFYIDCDLQLNEDYENQINTLAKTAGLVARLVAFGACCFTLSHIPLPTALEPFRFPVQVAGPWWASSLWADRVTYNFFCSALAKNPQKNLAIQSGEIKAGAISQFLCYEYYQDVHEAYRINRKTFLLCAVTITCLYLYVFWYLQPAVAPIILEKTKPVLKPVIEQNGKKALLYALQLKQTLQELCLKNESPCRNDQDKS